MAAFNDHIRNIALLGHAGSGENGTCGNPAACLRRHQSERQCQQGKHRIGLY